MSRDAAQGATPPPRARSFHRLAVRLRSLWRQFIRREVRENEMALLMVAAGLGIFVSIVVSLLHEAVALMHQLFYQTPLDGHLSAGDVGQPVRLILVPILGGLIYGGLAEVIRKYRKGEVVDPIEANALYGGRMSLGQSLGLTALAMTSLGVGASVGMEAGYTQAGSGFASKIGRQLHLRRGDMRTLVGCGAAAAISAAFNAPLAGAFYALELVVGNYTLPMLAPIGMASAASALTARLLFTPETIVHVPEQLSISRGDYLVFFLIGLAAAALAIVAMRGVTAVETSLRGIAVPRMLRPALGGVVLASMAYTAPEVLGGGHGAIQMTVDQQFPLSALAALLVGKLIASAVSVGCGFRGGLFSSSLFLGGLLGSLVATLITLVKPGFIDPVTLTLVGMGATGAAVVGAPVTMILLVLEMTGNYPVTLGVLVAVLVASVAVRSWFGYSFATWRFHLRGVRLRGAQDIGWIRDFRVGQMMRRDPNIVPAEAPLSRLCELYPVGSTKRLFVTGEGGRYLGMIDVAALHVDRGDGNDLRAADLARWGSAFLVPDTPVRQALTMFEKEAVEALPVVSDAKRRQIVGLVTEAFALRRYSQELERRRGEELGNSDLFGPSSAA